ncbi:MAG TPA: 3-oxoacyl-ACP reductase FabG [Chloroflexota bacterium]|nr:3-oxoacyl-ACP reductase FabG [Chloroflexota bacterium]
MRLEGKIALVTGAARGIGRGIAEKLGKEGADLALVDLQATALADTEQMLSMLGRRVLPLGADVGDRQQADAVVAAAIAQFGRLDILVNCAGINRDAILHRMTDEQWDDVIRVDLSAVFYLTRAATLHMRQRGSGRIINISSASWQGNVGQANYAAAKAGVIGLTKTAARELAPKGVTANAICPGFIETEMTRAMPPEAWQRIAGRIPMGRVGTPEDVGNVVAFLASDEASYVTGEVVNVGGGLVL